MTKKKTVVTVTTAVRLDAAQRAQAKELVLGRAGAAEVEFVENPAVLGGVQVAVGDQIFDATLQGQLQRLAISADRCQIITAVPLTDKQRSILSEAIHEKYGSMAIDEQVDPTVIGGIKVIIGSKEYDQTVLGKLTALETQARSQL